MRYACFALALTLLGSPALARDPACSAAARPGCASPLGAPHQPGCDCRQPCPHCHGACDQCRPPCDVPRRSVPEVGEELVPRAMPESGGFVAPPRTGAVRGPTNRLGIEGGSITLPELRLRFPTIELPGCFHSHTQARMMINEAEAAYVRTGPSVSEMALRQEAAYLRQEMAAREQEAAEQETGEAAPKIPVELERQREKAEAEVRRLEELQKCWEECLRRYHESGGRMQPGGELSPTPAQAPGKNWPAPPQPAPDDGTRRLPLPGQPRALPASFPARPASYIEQPVLLPPPDSAGVIREPQQRVIREPRGAITGVRPRLP